MDNESWVLPDAPMLTSCRLSTPFTVISTLGGPVFSPHPWPNPRYYCNRTARPQPTVLLLLFFVKITEYLLWPGMPLGTGGGNAESKQLQREL